MATRPDRRVRRTKELLHRALIELLLEKGYSRTTVQDILDRADVGRSTFYSHYRDKDDLLLVSCTEYLRTAVSEPDTSETPLWKPVHTILTLAERHREVYRALVGKRSSAVLIRATQQMVRDILVDHLRGRLIVDNRDFDSMLTFLSWGVTGLIGSVADESASAKDAFTAFENLAGHEARR
ncbi:TetR/AcrR family transcriptional regulator [Rhodococcus chondri]|uniref:Helix-turn-helix domain-containing protein n=1 Tax=Rhodococcus chondri TaxID=3065941 RepID=A0ABU7JTN7_9NOCA|nr:helix-turn-helix domain-containing protein [Rhodococcus sp. CC-R104]MEE2033388.1 helix-turn-helix domain-containing protein [Rhodococcus sp. CC-R104]